MSIHREPIKNIEQAKRYFIAMGCNHFHVARENFDRSDEYYALNISGELESEWRIEEFESQLSKISSIKPNELGVYYEFNLYGIINTNEYYVRGRNEYYLETLLTVLNNIKNTVPPEQVKHLLFAIIGRNGTQKHGGLIEKSFSLNRSDLAQEYINYAKIFIEVVKTNNIKALGGLRGFFVDVIEYYEYKGLNESREYLNQLREEDYKERFEDYSEVAKEGNIAAMIALAEHYVYGNGCEINYEKAEYWLSKAAKKRDISANEKFIELQDKLKKRKK